MKKRTKGLALLLSALLLLSLAACGSPAQTVTNALVKLAKLDSVHSEMSTNTVMNSMGMEISTAMTISMDSTKKPDIARMELQMSSMGVEMSAQSYAEKSGDGYVVYSSMDGVEWNTVTLSEADYQQYDAVGSLKIYLDSVESFVEGAKEEIDGTMAVRYDGAISNDSLNEVMAASGMEEQLTQYGLSAEEVAAMYTDLGELPVSIWIADDSGLPLRFEMDMSEILNTLMNKAMEALGAGEGVVTVSNGAISMSFSNFNAVAPIEIPEGVKG